MLDINKKKIMTRLEKLRRRHMEEAQEFNRDLKFLISSIEDSIDIELEQELKRQGWMEEENRRNYHNKLNQIVGKVDNFLDEHDINKESFEQYLISFEDHDFIGEEVIENYDEMIKLLQETYYDFEKIKLRIYIDNKFRTLTIKGDD